MGSLCGILILLVAHTAWAAVILQPTYPFETDVSKYKLIEAFYPENDRDVLPIAQLLQMLRADKGSYREEGDRAPSMFMKALSSSMKAPKYPKPYSRDASEKEGWKELLLSSVDESALGELLQLSGKCLKEGVAKVSGRRAMAEDSNEVEGPSVASRVLLEAVADAMGKAVKAAVKKLTRMRVAAD